MAEELVFAWIHYCKKRNRTKACMYDVIPYVPPYKGIPCDHSKIPLGINFWIGLKGYGIFSPSLDNATTFIEVLIV